MPDGILRTRSNRITMGSRGELQVTTADGRTWLQTVTGDSQVERVSQPQCTRDAEGREVLICDVRLPAFGPPPRYQTDALRCRLEVSAGPEDDSVTVRLTAPAHRPLHAVHYPYSFVCDGPEASLLFTHAEGVLLPLRPGAPGYEPLPWADIYGGTSCYCACLALLNPDRGDGALCIFETPELAAYEMTPTSWNGETLMLPRIVWRASLQRMDRPRVLTFSFSSHGGHTALAQQYARHCVRSGWVRTLRQKALADAEVRKLEGAPVFWVFGDDADVLHVASALKQDGVTRAVINIGAPWWNRSEGLEEPLRRMIDVVKSLRRMGYIVSRYDQYRDAYPVDPGQSLYHQINWEVYPDGGVRDADGRHVTGWMPPGVIINPQVGLELAQRRIGPELHTWPFNGRFIDLVGTCVFWEGEDYTPGRRTDAYQARLARERLLQYAVSRPLVLGTEGGIDCLLPYLHWLETPMSLVRWTVNSLPLPGWQPAELKPDYAINLDPRRRIPFYSLVHHAEVVSTWRWEDGLNRLPQHWHTKELFCMLYGAPPMFVVDRAHFDANRQRIGQSCRALYGWLRQVSFEPMVSHEFITPDRMVQRTRFANGRWAIVNFGTDTYRSSERTVLPGSCVTG